jgi:hypothetical protein
MLDGLCVSLLADQLVDRNTRRQLAAEQECSGVSTSTNVEAIIPIPSHHRRTARNSVRKFNWLYIRHRHSVRPALWSGVVPIRELLLEPFHLLLSALEI